MKIVVQRCERASCRVSGKIVGKIDQGLMLLVGFTHTDGIDEIKYMVDKVVNLRIFDDENGVMNRSLLDISGSVLSISQFTLYGDASKGRRPSYVAAMPGERATILYDKFNELLREKVKVETGIFGAEMKIDFVNDGPITILLEK